MCFCVCVLRRVTRQLDSRPRVIKMSNQIASSSVDSQAKQVYEDNQQEEKNNELPRQSQHRTRSCTASFPPLSRARNRNRLSTFPHRDVTDDDNPRNTPPKPFEQPIQGVDNGITHAVVWQTFRTEWTFCNF